MQDLSGLLAQTAERHHQCLCPRQVLGVRMGLYAVELLSFERPNHDKRIIALVESDGCLVDGIAVATGCSIGNRTMRVLDYGKTAATFVDTQTGQAIRIWPHPESRARACAHAPRAPDRWHAQLAAYQTMPTGELLIAQGVRLHAPLAALISQPGRRVVCAQCGEDVINAREIAQNGSVLCRPCAEGAYYYKTPQEPGAPGATEQTPTAPA